MKEIKFECDICKKHKPFAEIYPYEKNKNSEIGITFRGCWSYCCLRCFIGLKICEKLGLLKYKYAWVKTDAHEFSLMMKEIGEMRK